MLDLSKASCCCKEHHQHQEQMQFHVQRCSFQMEGEQQAFDNKCQTKEALQVKTCCLNACFADMLFKHFRNTALSNTYSTSPNKDLLMIVMRQNSQR